MNTRLILASLMAAAFTACGGGSDDTPGAAAPSAPAEAVTGNVSITLSFPAGPSAESAGVKQALAAAQAIAQTQSYISPKTQSVSIVLASVNGAPPATPVGATVDVKPGSACVVSGSSLNCTVTLAAPVGTDGFVVDTWPGTGAGGNMPISSGTGTAVVAANGSAVLAVDLLPRVNEFAVDITPAAGTQPIDAAGTFTAHIRAKDSAGDIITGTTPYHDPIVVTDKDVLTGHITASPSLPVTFDSPEKDTITFTYDGAGTAASYAFDVKSGISQTVNLSLASNVEHLYVAQRSANRIDVYDIQDDGSLTGPSRSLVGAHTGLDNPTSIAVDPLGQLYVTNSHSLSIFAPGAGGDATPLQTTRSNGADVIYVSDQAGMIMTRTPKDPDTGAFTTTVNVNYGANPHFATDPNLPPGGIPPFQVNRLTPAVASYSSGAGGYVCTTYTDSVDNNQNRVQCFTQPIFWASGQAGLASDHPNIQIFNGAANYSITCCFVDAVDLKFLSNGVLVVSSNAKHNKAAALETYIVKPEQRLKSISGESTGIDSPGAIAVDSKGRLYVVNYGLFGGTGAVLQFAPDAPGERAPGHKLTGFSNLGGIAIGK
jgi:hypothetical protein